VNSPQDQSAEPAAEVAVTVDSCDKSDARTVFAALHTTFPSDRAPDDAPAEPENGRPIVWAATFDVSRTLGLPGPGRLDKPVTVTAQGGYHAVDRLREGLAEAFAVRVVGTASGDQEEEVQMRLENLKG
jgi:hypothetical protein